VDASAAEIYRFTFWYHFTAATASGTTLIPTVVWKTSGDDVISTSTGATLTATGDNTGWVQYPVQTWTAPATTAKATVTFTSEFADRTADAAEILMFDDVEFTPVGSLNEVENKPIPWFWARDTKGYDFMVYTARLRDAWVMTETTRQLTNAVWASYESTYTSVAEDSTSQAAYRQRDVVISAGDLDETSAEQYRDTYLARWKDPTEEPTNLNARRLTVLNKRGLPVDPTVLRAGHRIKIMDGLRAGTIVILTSTSYSNNVAQLTPDRYMEMPVLLARVV
jgi:hypothetical protein